MKQSLSWIILILLLMSLSGCSNGWFSTSGAAHEAIQGTRIPYGAPIIPSKEIEESITEHFYTSPIEWDKGSWDRVVVARHTLTSIFKDAGERRDVAGGISFYAYKYSTELSAKQWNIIEKEFDAHAAKWIIRDGKKIWAVSRDGKIIYDLMKDRIKFQLWQQQQTLKAAEQGIDEDVSNDMMNQYEQLFNVMQPLIDIVL